MWEWVEDIYHDSYKGAPTDGTTWIDTSRDRVFRGGSWNVIPSYCRSARRSGGGSGYRNNALGFRLARTLD